MRDFFKNYTVLTKTGIVVFVIVGGIAGYTLGLEISDGFNLQHLLITLTGLYFISAGSFALNQVQEREIDRKMERTRSRPVAAGIYQVGEVYFLALMLITIGTLALWLAEPLAAIMGLFTVVLYNGFYTLIWKRYWAFGAVPGAIPGAMPVVIGYAAVRSTIFTAECFYLFLVMFLWQMPHFWSIAIKCKKDYEKGGVPVLPSVVGDQKAIFHIGLYTFVYLGLAIASPWFVPVRYAYLFLVVPVAFKMLFEFLRYAKSFGQQGWLKFFLWTNVSVLIFLAAPVVDKWFMIFKNL